MGIALSVLALRSADEEAPPTVNRTGMRTTLDPGQLTDADDRFQIKPVLAYFKAAWKLKEAELTVWTADLNKYTQILDSDTPDELVDIVVPTRNLVFYTIPESEQHVPSLLNVKTSTSDFVVNVRRYLDQALRFVAVNASAYDARIMSLSQNEINRFKDEELTSWTAMLNEVDDLLQLFAEKFDAAFPSEDEEVTQVLIALSTASPAAQDASWRAASEEAFASASEALRALQTNALYLNLLSEDPEVNYWVLFG
jgi:succinate dehydrogenase flavin-adding protein (antitoxin of CptAB toxin-antitoxin module)